MYDRTDEQAAKDLIELRFDGRTIDDSHIGRKRTMRPYGRPENSATRRLIAEEVFIYYVGEATKRS